MNRDLSIFQLIRAAIWGTVVEEATEEEYEEMKLHAIAALPANILKSIKMSAQLREVWNKSIIQCVANNTLNRFVQKNIPLTVPYVILKGTSVAQYYPFPAYRIMGDIDIITKREDFYEAYKQLKNNGHKVIYELGREVSFQKNGVTIELHRYFASLNDPEQSQYLDDLIIENITPTHILPDMINGLVLLEHISQHLEHGLGLRQIIDWMMFVDKCLPDDKWPEFCEMAKNIGLKRLAIIATKMCETYLGLHKRKWCEEADITVCDQLMEYIMSSGNFGNKWVSESAVGENVFFYIRKPIAAFKWLQERGKVNWEAVQKYPFLKPFAWIYQTGRYLKRGFKQEGSTSALKAEYIAAKKRIDLFESLGVKQKAKGLVVYKNGKYVKK